MSLKDIITEDVAKVFFNNDEFAERVVYNDRPLLAIISEGRERVQGNTFGSGVEADRAEITVMTEDVPEPSKGDRIVVGSKEWEVARVKASDSTTHTLECIANERPRW